MEILRRTSSIVLTDDILNSFDFYRAIDYATKSLLKIKLSKHLDIPYSRLLIVDSEDGIVIIPYFFDSGDTIETIVITKNSEVKYLGRKVKYIHHSYSNARSKFSLYYDLPQSVLDRHNHASSLIASNNHNEQKVFDGILFHLLFDDSILLIHINKPEADKEPKKILTKIIISI